MSPPPVPRILVVSDSEDWSLAMSIVFENRGAIVASASARAGVKRAESFHPTFAVIDVDGGMQLPNPSDRLALARQSAVALHGYDALLPIVLMTSMPSDGLAALTQEFDWADVLLADRLDPGVLAIQCLAAHERLVSKAVEPVKTSFGTIEISIGQATLRCDIKVGNETATWGPTEWRSRDLMKDLDDEVRSIESSKKNFSTLDVTRVGFFGRRVMQTFDEPLKFAYDFCDTHLAKNSPIFHRFALNDGDLEFVPFEVITTHNRAEHLRFVYPVARRLVPCDAHTEPPRSATVANRRQRVLFIVSDASGVFEVKGLTFKSEAKPTLAKLKYLDEELLNIGNLHGTELLALKLLPGEDNIKRIADAFQASHFDIVHFAGHSLRSDAGDRVFLALPGPNTLVATPFDAEDFAYLAAQNDVRLVVLSSCEGCSGLALSRMASSGVPAIAGFRWPVDDRDASFFTTRFHEELCNHAPICSAFHSALLDLKRHYPQRLTVFSPILMMQSPAWHEYALEQ